MRGDKEKEMGAGEGLGGSETKMVTEIKGEAERGKSKRETRSRE